VREKPVLLLAEEIPGLTLAGDPEAVALEHPLWAEFFMDFGPWAETGFSPVEHVPDERGPFIFKGWRSARACKTGIFLSRSCSSALDVAWKFWQGAILQEWDAVIAVRQWAGRGQVRRPWSSMPGNLHVAWRLPALPGEWGGLASLIPAWLSARALSTLGGWNITIKWPNDLLWQNRKVGGLLLEERGDQVLAGLGLNLAVLPEPEALRERCSVPGIALDGRINPVTCWNFLVSEYRNWYKEILPCLCPEDFIQDFTSALAWKDRRVLLHEHGCEVGVPAMVLGVSATGALLVSVDGMSRTVSSGEIRLFHGEP